jgi:membrane fusion protein, multidrug efflux system
LDANGRSVLVRARLANSSGNLRAGMYARARIVFDVRERALVVPEEALVPLGEKQYLFKVVDGPGGTKVAKRMEARIGHRVPGKVEVLEGVAAGDVVVIAGQARLLRGDALPVRVVDLTGQSGTTAPAPRGNGGAAPPAQRGASASM